MYSTQFRKGLIYLGLGFFILFCFRLMYGYVMYPINQVASLDHFTESTAWRADFEPKNYASDKLLKQGNQITVDQKYEKIGTLTTTSHRFDEDEKTLRSFIGTHQALIQFEQRLGLVGHRTLSLAMGVSPAQFDAMIEAVKHIGQLLFIQIDKRDKTNEYKELKAKRISLEKTRNGLTALKGQGGRVEELIQLEDRILQIENDIQSLGVKLGEYDQENEFCTVKLTLLETTVTPINIPVLQRLKVALEWTIKIYLQVIAILCVGSFLILFTILILQIGSMFLERSKKLKEWVTSVLKAHHAPSQSE